LKKSTLEIIAKYAIQVKGHQRTSKSGKMTTVNTYQKKGDKKVRSANPRASVQSVVSPSKKSKKTDKKKSKSKKKQESKTSKTGAGYIDVKKKLAKSTNKSKKKAGFGGLMSIKNKQDEIKKRVDDRVNANKETKKQFDEMNKKKWKPKDYGMATTPEEARVLDRAYKKGLKEIKEIVLKHGKEVAKTSRAYKKIKILNKWRMQEWFRIVKQFQVKNQVGKFGDPDSPHYISDPETIPKEYDYPFKKKATSKKSAKKKVVIPKKVAKEAAEYNKKVAKTPKAIKAKAEHKKALRDEKRDEVDKRIMAKIKAQEKRALEKAKKAKRTDRQALTDFAMRIYGKKKLTDKMRDEFYDVRKRYGEELWEGYLGDIEFNPSDVLTDSQVHDAIESLGAYAEMLDDNEVPTKKGMEYIKKHPKSKFSKDFDPEGATMKAFNAANKGIKLRAKEKAKKKPTSKKPAKKDLKIKADFAQRMESEVAVASMWDKHRIKAVIELKNAYKDTDYSKYESGRDAWDKEWSKVDGIIKKYEKIKNKIDPKQKTKITALITEFNKTQSGRNRAWFKFTHGGERVAYHPARSYADHEYSASAAVGDTEKLMDMFRGNIAGSAFDKEIKALGAPIDTKANKYNQDVVGMIGNLRKDLESGKHTPEQQKWRKSVLKFADNAVKEKTASGGSLQASGKAIKHRVELHLKREKAKQPTTQTERRQKYYSLNKQYLATKKKADASKNPIEQGKLMNKAARFKKQSQKYIKDI